MAAGKPLLDQFMRFMGIGAIATGLQYSILVALTEAGLADPVVASTLGYVVSAGLNYALNYRFTFSSEELHRRATIKFSIVIGVGLVLNSGLMYVAIHQVGLNYLVAQILATICVVIWHFLLHRNWTYRASVKAL